MIMLIQKRFFNISRRLENFNFNKIFEYLNNSEKYETINKENKNDFEKIYKLFVNEKRINSKKIINFDFEKKLNLCDYLKSNNDFNSKILLKKIFDTELLFQNENSSNIIYNLKPEIFIKLLYYCANYMYKKNSGNLFFFQDYLETNLNYNYNSKELSIIFHSIFRLNLILSENSLKSFIITFSNLNNEDQIFLIFPFTKLLRQQKYYDYNFLIKIKTLFLKNQNEFKIQVLINLVNTFASFSVYDQELFELLENNFEKNLDNLRLKDVSKLLWSLSFTSYEFQNENKIISLIKDKLKDIRSKYVKGDIKYLIDILKSMIFLGILDDDLYELILNNKFCQLEIEKSNLKKIESDLFFILESIKIEKKKTKFSQKVFTLAKPIKKFENKELIIRKNYKKFESFLKSTNPELKIDYPLSHINISSFMLKKNNEITYYDLVDETNSLKNNEKLKGPFKTKLRQLNVLKYNYKLYKVSNNSFVPIN